MTDKYHKNMRDKRKNMKAASAFADVEERLTRFFSGLVFPSRKSTPRKTISPWRARMIEITARAKAKREPLWDSTKNGTFIRSKRSALR